MRNALLVGTALAFLTAVATSAVAPGQAGAGPGQMLDGKRLFEQATFGGNGRTCRTCHGAATGTVSPEDAQQRFQQNAAEPLFLLDGSDDGQGHGVTRMLTDATILMTITMAPNVQLADDPTARTVIVRRGIPTTLNTPALDPVLMLDGRESTLEHQAAGAIHDHAQAVVVPDGEDLLRIKQFQLTDAFFSSSALRDFARGAAAPPLPAGTTESEKRGRRFFEDLPPNLPPASGDDFKPGLCASCHSGPLLNHTNQFLPVPLPVGSRFQTVGISEFNRLGNPVRDFIFTNPDGSETHVVTPDPGRALITGIGQELGTFDSVNAFKIPGLRGIRLTAPYFHDNSAKTLEDVAAHYALFFNVVTGGFLNLTPQDQADIVAFMKLL